MSATRPSRRPAGDARIGARPSERPVAHTNNDMSELHTRRRETRRRRHLLRVDLALGLLGGIVLLLATAGVAIAALIALALLGLCAVSVMIERRRRSRRR